MAGLLSLPLNSVVCVASSLILAYLPHLYRAFGVVAPKLIRDGKKFDLRYPRAEYTRAVDATVEGQLVERLTGCHNNGLEAFASFGVAVAVALATGAEAEKLNRTATLFLALRVLYTYCYVTGVSRRKALIRLVTWVAGIGCTLAIFTQAYSAAQLRQDATK